MNPEWIWTQRHEELPFTEFCALKEVWLTLYIDIQQIKYSKRANREHFDSMPPLNRFGRHKWHIEGEQLAKLQRRKTYVFGMHDNCIKSGVDGWEMSFGIKNRNRESREGSEFYLDDKPPHLPLFIWDLGTKGTIQISINKKNQRPILIDRECLGGFPLNLDLDISDAISLDLDIQWEIAWVFDKDETKIKEIDWESFGISSQEDEHLLAGCFGFCCLL